MAGALAAELRGLLARWAEVVELHQRFMEFDSTLWAVGESYFPVFDGAGHRLSLLPCELATETVTCYVRLKALLDNLRFVSLLGEREARVGEGTVREGGQASHASDRAIQYGDKVAESARRVLVKLDQVAGTRQGKQPPKCAGVPRVIPGSDGSREGIE